ncbi:MAG: N-acylglucosamine 2-epimerase [Planctomycetota bacterium]|nr:MAG: N-acylglucosamine 2-epimerase [Planctomycetota bacterium]
MTAASPNKAISAERLAQLDRDYRGALLDDTLPFWLERCPDFIDPEHGGYMTARDRDGTLLDSDKGIWQQGRSAWLFSTLYNSSLSSTEEPRRRWLDAASSGIRFLEEHGFDPKDGRMWFHVARDGSPIRKRRYAFSESFAAIAFAAYAKATANGRLAERSVQCLDAFLCHRPEPKFTSARTGQSMGPPMIAMVTAQTLRECIGFDRAETVIDQAIETIESFFVKDDIRCVMENVGPAGEVLEHFDFRTLNPGHAIEGAWFILHEAKHRDHDAQLINLGCRMLDYMWERGWDQSHGGILYFRDVHNKPVQEYWHDMKFWWPQNEGIIATLLAYQLSGDAKYARWHTLLHDWAYQHFHDPEYGEWLGYLHRDGSASSPLKGNLWKGPFHMPRMQMYCAQIIQELMASTGPAKGRQEA